MRSIAIFGAVGALVAAVALPAYASTTPTTEAATTLQQIAVDDAQSLVVASEATAAPINRGNYSATTPEEIAQKKAAAAAAARAEAAAKAAASSRNTGGGYSTAGVALVAPGSGEVRNPVGGSYYVSRTLGGSHNGADMVGDSGTPIYAAAAGKIRISSDSYFGYGVGVVIDHVLGGQQVSTLYGHMIYGSRQVQVGQTVQAGQLIGFMGNTGQSRGEHLHFEVRIGGSLVEPIGWLNANGAPA
ncbi:M23 family metallopeptidase [Microbacterium sp. M28]|uniref:M23 family metallopeptidase n=1 Tax=Microbacterium sp. M28 TaxID=2962064 RepID=UPI0021F4A167|nr:M23 family metallopeptidase [Microbacterium sp. M28]UYO97949.1 M23 family metallopeptidase [Microbacterium sp. M28]